MTSKEKIEYLELKIKLLETQIELERLINKPAITDVQPNIAPIYPWYPTYPYWEYTNPYIYTYWSEGRTGDNYESRT